MSGDDVLDGGDGHMLGNGDLGHRSHQCEPFLLHVCLHLPCSALNTVLTISPGQASSAPSVSSSLSCLLETLPFHPHLIHPFLQGLSSDQKKLQQTDHSPPICTQSSKMQTRSQKQQVRKCLQSEKQCTCQKINK